MPERVSNLTTQGVNSPSVEPNLTLEVNVGDTFAVSLPENGASTGYVWRLASDETGMVSFNRKEYEAAQNSMPGAPGTAHFHFAAKKPGTILLVFELNRSWDSKKPIETRVIEVTIK